MVALLLSVTLQILGFAAIVRLGEHPLMTQFAKKFVMNIVATAFLIAPVSTAAAYIPSVVFMSAIGILIYIWWLGAICGAIIFRG